MSIARYNYSIGSISSNNDVNIDGDLYVQGNIVSDGNITWPVPIEITKLEVPASRTNDYLFPIATWTGSSYVPVWNIIFANMIGGGITGQMIVRASNGFGQWSDSIAPLNVNVRGDLQLNGNSGSAGNVLIKNSSNQPVWSRITISNISPGTANTVLTTNAAGNAVVWSNNLTLATLNLTGNLQFSGTSGTTGQYLRKTSGTAQTWSNIAATDITPGTGNDVLVTIPGGTTGWSNSLTLSGLTSSTVSVNATLNTSGVTNISGNVRLNGTTGSVGQYIRKTATSTQQWASIVVSDITPGTANTILTTNSTGSTPIWTNVLSINTLSTITLNATGTTNLSGNLQFSGTSGTAGQYLRKTSNTAQTWSNIAVSDIPPGTANTVLATGSDGLVGWSGNLNIITLFATNLNVNNISNFHNLAFFHNGVYLTKSLPITQDGITSVLYRTLILTTRFLGLDDTVRDLTTSVTIYGSIQRFNDNIMVDFPNFTVNTTTVGGNTSGRLVFQVTSTLPLTLQPNIGYIDILPYKDGGTSFMGGVNFQIISGGLYFVLQRRADDPTLNYNSGTVISSQFSKILHFKCNKYT